MSGRERKKHTHTHTHTRTSKHTCAHTCEHTHTHTCAPRHTDTDTKAHRVRGKQTHTPSSCRVLPGKPTERRGGVYCSDGGSGGLERARAGRHPAAQIGQHQLIPGLEHKGTRHGRTREGAEFINITNNKFSFASECSFSENRTLYGFLLDPMEGGICHPFLSG